MLIVPQKAVQTPAAGRPALLLEDAAALFASESYC